MREKSTKKTGEEYFRSDLACESLSPAAETEERTEMEGAVTVLRRREADGGRSVTVICGEITAWGDEARSRMADILVRELWRMTEAMTGRRVDGNLRVLVVGLGNAHMTPDAVGPDTVRRLTVTRHLREHDEAYLGFMAETGAEYVGRMVKWIYFRKKTEDGPFDIFSDVESRIAHLDRIIWMLRFVGIANLAIGLANSLNPVIDFGWVNLLCATLLMYALGRIEGKKEALEQDRLLIE